MDRHEIEAAVRRESNRFSPTNEPLSQPGDRNSSAAEEAFCWAFGVPQDARPRRRTPGYQFTLNGRKVKVYAAPVGKNLLVPQGKVRADVYVLAWIDYPAVALVGWCRAADVSAAPAAYRKEDGPYRIASHRVRTLDVDGDWAALRAELAIPDGDGLLR